MKLEDAYFGIMRPNFNNGDRLEEDNLFGSMRVLRSVALYRTKKDQLMSAGMDPLHFCFGDTRARCEYEWCVSPFAAEGETEKVDVYEMYVLPNKKYLMELVESISVDSCRKWLRAHKR